MIAGARCYALTTLGCPGLVHGRLILMRHAGIESLGIIRIRDLHRPTAHDCRTLQDVLPSDRKRKGETRCRQFTHLHSVLGGFSDGIAGVLVHELPLSHLRRCNVRWYTYCDGKMACTIGLS